MSKPPAWLRGSRLLVLAVVAVGVVLAGGRVVTSVLVEALWQAETGYAAVFWKRVAWQWGARVLTGLAVGVLIFLNLRIVSATLGGIQIRRRFGNIEISEQLPRSYVMWGMVGASALLALWFGAAVPQSVGIQALMLAHGASWGQLDPILGRDLGFYVFWLPVLGSAITFALVVTFLLFTLVTAGYAATGALRWGGKRIVAQDLTRVHLGGLLALFLVLLGLRFWLGRSLLMLDGNSGVQGIVGFADVEARLPALQTLGVICVVAAGMVLWGAIRARGTAIVGSLITVMLAYLVIGEFYPGVVQRFRVEPNELERETPFIEHALAYTRSGFGLDNLERRPFRYRAGQPVDWGHAGRQFAGLPVWNQSALLTTFRSIEARFPYYDFTDVAIDRYPTEAGPVTLALAVREVDPGGIQDPNWQNRHIRERYVEGMGVVASLAAEKTPEGRPPMVLSGIPPELSSGRADLGALRLERPQIFFGLRPQMYAVVNPGDEQFLTPEGLPGEVALDFPGGIELRSALRTLALAWRFRDANLLFAAEVGEGSRFIFRRSVAERARAIAPFLRFPDDPYPVVSGGRVIWMLEGFTATRAFPLSQPSDLEFLRPVTYLRNSVKVTVDAVSGRVDFYRVPVEDPLADVYAAAFPNFFRPIEEMPAELRDHIRYPRQLLAVQARVLLQYHQETAPAFHGQQDVWDQPTELAQGTSPVPYRAEYGIYSLPGEEEPRFHLTTVFVPAGRQNLTSILTARTNDAGVGELILHDVSVEDQVPGPRQIEALIEQDPQISQQFSLWRTGGSEVWTGHLHLVPVGGRLMYMEPVFLAAEADAIPELRRYVVSDGVRVAMSEDLASTLTILAGARLPPTEAGTAAGEAGEATLWPARALELLEAAEARLREGDWSGFGQALDELRSLLRSLAPGG